MAHVAPLTPFPIQFYVRKNEIQQLLFLSQFRTHEDFLCPFSQIQYCLRCNQTSLIRIDMPVHFRYNLESPL